MNKRVNPNQLSFDFPAPGLWAAPLVPPPGRLLADLRIDPDAQGVFDYRPLHSFLRAARDGLDWRVRLDLGQKDLSEWHGGDLNDNGCYQPKEKVVLACDGDATVVARLATTGRGHWMCGYELRFGSHCSSGPAGVMTVSGAVSREAALAHFASQNVRWFEDEQVTKNSCVGLPARRRAGRIADKLRAYAVAA